MDKAQLDALEQQLRASLNADSPTISTAILTQLALNELPTWILPVGELSLTNSSLARVADTITVRGSFAHPNFGSVTASLNVTGLGDNLV